MKVDKRRSLTTKLAYIAGFVDGEGCVRIKKGTASYYVTFQVTNTDRKPLQMIKKIFGGKVYFQEKGTNKTVWQYYATCNEAVDICRTLIGFSTTKKKQMELAIKYHDNKEGWSKTKRNNAYKKIRELKL